jgi:hypothetical protein
VISQVERLSSNEMNIAPRSLRIAPEWVVATSLCQSAGRYPPPHGILIGSGEFA